jgi:squalene synthase HpnC
VAGPVAVPTVEPSAVQAFGPRGRPTFEPSAVLLQARHENFPVAPLVLPRRVRADLRAIYGFARLADDIGDRAEGDRLAQLDWLDAELWRAALGRATHPLLRSLTPLLRERCLSVDPFRSLIEANRRDQLVSRYATFGDLVGYCRLSAVPVGRLVLAVLGAATPDRVARSDDVCTGLQIAEHLQDVGEDARRDRVYLPMADLQRCGVTEGDLTACTAGPALRRLVALEASRARRLLGAGRALAATLPWRSRVAVAGFAAGGQAALDAVVGAGYDVLGTECRPSRLRLGTRLLGNLVGEPAGAGAV